MSITKRERAINDWAAKIVFVPLAGILFSNVGGLIDNTRFALPALLLQYAYFTIISLLVWLGNSAVISYLKKKMYLDSTSYARYLFIILSASILYSGIAAVLLLKLWSAVAHVVISGNSLAITCFVIVCISALITTIYENYLLNIKKLSALSKFEQMSLAKTQAELMALKNQIDPHFMFNSLNTLSYLIASDARNAKLYNDTLARVYQYILRNKDKDLVLLREEIEFVSNYFYLLKIRFNNTINMSIEISNVEAEELLIPPISLQTLVENAIKHNEFSDSAPLHITVSVSSNYVVVKNRVKIKTYPVPASKVGLANLDNRYRLITKRSITVDNSNYFTVKLPIINLNT